MTTNSPVLAPEVLNRLLIGRELLRNFGPNLTPQSDALAVARAILNAHDAAELIISAIADQLQAGGNKKPPLLDYIQNIEKKRGGILFPGKLFLKTLNEQRVQFKHHGAFPNVSEFHQVLTKTTDYLGQACSIYLGISLFELDRCSLIADDEARGFYLEARDLSHVGKYREALESLARAMDAALQEKFILLSVNDNQSEIALQLTAYGVDPGAFIRMQQFLPEIGLSEKREWNARLYGHRGNWRSVNVEFCLSTVLDLILKLQHAPYQPSAVDFEYLFDDVITAKRDDVSVYAVYCNPLFGVQPTDQSERKLFGEMKQGQYIKGRLIPAQEYESFKWQDSPFAFADIYVMQSPVTNIREPIPDHMALIVKAGDVEWSSTERKGIRTRFPDLFDENPTED